MRHLPLQPPQSCQWTAAAAKVRVQTCNSSGRRQLSSGGTSSGRTGSRKRTAAGALVRAGSRFGGGCCHCAAGSGRRGTRGDSCSRQHSGRASALLKSRQDGVQPGAPHSMQPMR